MEKVWVKSSAKEYNEALLYFGAKIDNYCRIKRYQTGGVYYVTRKGYFIKPEAREILRGVK